MKNKLVVLQLLMLLVVSVVHGMDEQCVHALVRTTSLASFAAPPGDDGQEGELVDDGVSLLGQDDLGLLAHFGQAGSVLVTDGQEEGQGSVAEFNDKANDYLLSLWILRRYDPRFFYSSDRKNGRKPVADLRGAMARYLRECVEGDFDDSRYCAKIVELATVYSPMVLRAEFVKAKYSWDMFWWQHQHGRDERFRALDYQYNRSLEKVEDKHMYDLVHAQELMRQAREEKRLHDLLG